MSKHFTHFFFHQKMRFSLFLLLTRLLLVRFSPSICFFSQSPLAPLLGPLVLSPSLFLLLFRSKRVEKWPRMQTADGLPSRPSLRQTSQGHGKRRRRAGLKKKKENEDANWRSIDSSLHRRLIASCPGGDRNGGRGRREGHITFPLGLFSRPSRTAVCSRRGHAPKRGKRRR